MKSLFLKLWFFTILFSALACSEDDPEPAFEDGNFYTEAYLEIENREGIPLARLMAGENIVFEYLYSHPGNPDATDDEFSYSFLWQVALGSTSFTIDNPKDHTAFYAQSCFCMPQNSSDVSGRITGHKISATTWQVELDVTVTTSAGSEHISHQRQYKISELQ